MSMAEITFDEHNQWKKMKFGHFNSCSKIKEIINYKLKKITEFQKKYNKYENKLPNI